MFGENFEGGEQRQVGGIVFEQREAAFGHGAGLIEKHGVDALHGFESARVRDENAAAGSRADGRRDRHGRGDAERAGAGDDQDRDGAQQGFGGMHAGHDQQERGERGKGDHAGHEDAGDLVGHAFDIGAAAEGGFDRPKNLREQAVVAHGGDADFEHAAGIEAAARDRVARAAGDRAGFTGENAFIDIGFARDHDAIGGNALTGSDQEGVAGRESVNGEEALPAVVQHAGFHGEHGVETGDGAAGGFFRVAFQVPAKQHQGHDGAGDIEIEVVAAEKRFGGAVAISGQDADGEQGFHAGDALPKAAPGEAQNGLSGEEDHGRGERHDQERQEVLQTAAQIDGEVQRHDIQPEESRDAQAEQFAAAVGRLIDGLAGVRADLVAEAAEIGFHAADRQVLRAVPEAQQVRGEEDFGLANGGFFGEDVFDEPAAGAAPHAGDVKELLFDQCRGGDGAGRGRALRVGDQAEGEAAAEEFGIARVRAFHDGAALLEDGVDVAAAHAAEGVIGRTGLGAERAFVSEFLAERRRRGGGHFSSSDGPGWRGGRGRRETRGSPVSR